MVGGPLLTFSASKLKMEPLKRRLMNVSSPSEARKIVNEYLPLLDWAGGMLGDAMKSLSALGPSGECPAGYINVQEHWRSESRSKMGDIMTGILTLPLEVDPEVMRKGLTENTEILVEVLDRWGKNLLKSPLEILSAARNVSMAARPEASDIANMIKSAGDTVKEFSAAFTKWSRLLTPAIKKK